VTPSASGLLVVDKPAGLTSHDVVARVRRLAGTRKVGHAGTLDPMATGVLVLGINRATRLLGHLTLSEKSYDATVRLGVATSTDDAEGEVLASVDATGLTEKDVRDALGGFVGELQQVPSTVSAVKVDGRRAYDRARAGEDVELAPRTVMIDELVVRGMAAGTTWLDVDLSVRCSSGTYVRALARDAGRLLGVGGHLTALRRTAVGPVGLDEAAPLGALEEAGDVTLVPMATIASRFFPTFTADEDQSRDVGFGRPLAVDLPVGPPTAVLGPDGSFLALYRPGDAPGTARAVAVFA
jgi:tRNA pseudouridine55 synthase